MTRRRRFVVAGIAILLALVAVAEVGLRYFTGLGNPPRLMAHPTIEYLYEPSRTYWRRGNRISFNRHSMRSDDFASKKTDGREFRLLVLGDSVVNGGAQSDQAAMATEIVRDELTRDLGRPVVVGNVSAGSWGPPNLLAYAREYGLFDADAVVIVLSSHDAADAPSATQYQPPRKPILALQELAERFLGSVASEPSVDASLSDHALPQCIDAVRDLIALCQAAGAEVIVLQHYEKGELDEVPPGHAAISRAAGGARVSTLGPALKASLKSGVEPYRDFIHLNDAGQRLLANAIRQAVLAQFAPSTSRPTS